MTRRLSLVGILVFALAGLGCNVFGPSGEVVYSVTGTATRVDLTYENSSGGTSQIANAVVPWEYSWTTAEKGDFLYVSAQIVSEAGSITVTINKDGKTLQSSTSSGFASIATASGTY